MKTRVSILTFALALALLVAGLALAAGDVERPRQVLSGGASQATTAGGASLQGTLGQPVVGVVSGSGGRITLGQGFWHGAEQHHIYLPVLTRQDA
jgi:hypothetical protein